MTEIHQPGTKKNCQCFYYVIEIGKDILFEEECEEAEKI